MIGEEVAKKLQWAFLYELKAQEEYFEISRELSDEEHKNTLEHIAEEEAHHADEIKRILHKLGYRAFTIDIEKKHEEKMAEITKK